MTLKISQLDLITKMTQGFNEDLKSIMHLNTLDTSHKGIVRNQETDINISYYLQKIYMSGIGSLLYLDNHSQTELSQTVLELSKCMN